MNPGPRLILASASPRRRELLGFLCAEFEVVVSGVNETLDAPASGLAASRLALRKARAVAARVGRGVVLAADTLVVAEGESLGKPAGPDEARAMLIRLSGRAHHVITGVAVVEAETNRERCEAATSSVFMQELGSAEIDAYVASGEPLDKAGAYAIQGRGGRFVTALFGSYSNVVGLPLPQARALLAAFGVPVASAPSA
jgi:septum formation protein